MSKIQSESNSQLSPLEHIVKSSCDQYVKDTIWKQFTTGFVDIQLNNLLWPICQRYNLKAIHNPQAVYINLHLVVTNMSKIQSESNSQQLSMGKKGLRGCDQYVKDTIWKQFTTNKSNQTRRKKLWPICQRYNLKAIHNWRWCWRNYVWLWPICQRYNLKAIHNYAQIVVVAQAVVTNMSKIQSESNSQQNFNCFTLFPRCDQYVKDTIWKQFTTRQPSR